MNRVKVLNTSLVARKYVDIAIKNYKAKAEDFLKRLDIFQTFITNKYYHRVGWFIKTMFRNIEPFYSCLTCMDVAEQNQWDDFLDELNVYNIETPICRDLVEDLDKYTTCTMFLTNEQYDFVVNHKQ